MFHFQLRKHQLESFRRSPMFEQNLAVRISMYFMFGFLALEMLILGLFLDKILVNIDTYGRTIDTFNSFLPYIFVFDFVIKFFFKTKESMQIAPYLTLPIKRKQLFGFLLRKEFTNIWNFYILFLVIPFAFMAVTPFFGFPAVVLYILLIYLLCITNSLILNIINDFICRSFWFYTLAAIWITLPFFLVFVCKIKLGYYFALLVDKYLNYNLWIYVAFAVIFATLWFLNRLQMRSRLYYELQGDKTDKISSFSSLTFLNKFGSIGNFINLELKMIFRSPRLKQQIIFPVILINGLFFYMLYSPNNIFAFGGQFIFFIYGTLVIGFLGLKMGQVLFTSESSFFDGLASRKTSIFELLKSKYILYSSYSLLITLLLSIPVLQGKINVLWLLSLFFYIIGPIYFLIFQNAVYNKSYLDLFDKGMFSWKGTSGNMLIVSMFAMFLPVVLLLMINAFFGEIVTCYFMLFVGLAFTLTTKYWLTWTYNRFLKRKHKNMNGFRCK